MEFFFSKTEFYIASNVLRSFSHSDFDFKNYLLSICTFVEKLSFRICVLIGTKKKTTLLSQSEIIFILNNTKNKLEFLFIYIF